MAEGAGWGSCLAWAQLTPTRLATLGDPGSSPGQALPLSGGGGASGFVAIAGAGRGLPFRAQPVFPGPKALPAVLRFGRLGRVAHVPA